MSRTVVRLERWAAIVIAEGFDTAIVNIPGAKTSESVPDMIRTIAEYLTKEVKGSKGDLLQADPLEQAAAEVARRFSCVEAEEVFFAVFSDCIYSILCGLKPANALGQWPAVKKLSCTICRVWNTSVRELWILHGGRKTYGERSISLLQ